MPGSIRVSVIESVDMPPEATEGKYVSVKVGIGKREFQTRPSEANGDKTATWNSDFAFPVLNLRDNLMVALLDSKGNAISRTEIGTPIIVEKGSLDELFPLKGGGCVHLRLRFALTLEERMRIEAMRDAALKKQYRTVNKNATTKVPNPAEENKTSALVSGTVIPQTIPEDGMANDGSHNEKNQITTIVVPQLSLPNEMQKNTESNEGVSLAPISSPIEHIAHNEASSNGLKDIDHNLKECGRQLLSQHDLEEAILPKEIQKKTGSIEEASLALTSLPIENVTHKEASSHDLKDISDQILEENGRQTLAVHDIMEAASTLSPKELTPPKDSSLFSSNMLFPKVQYEEVMEANAPFVNEYTMPAGLSHVKDGLAELETSDIHTSLDKLSMIGPERTEFVNKDTTPLLAEPVVISEIPSSKELTPHKDSSVVPSNMSPSKVQSEEAMQTNAPFPNENIMPAWLAPVKDSLAELENSDVHYSTDKFSMIGPRQTEFTTSIHIIHGTGETLSQGAPIHQENKTLSIASSGSCPPLDSSDGQVSANLDTQFATDGRTSDMLPPSTEEGTTTSSLSTDLSVLPLQSSRDGSISSTPLVDIPGDATGEKNIPFPILLTESSLPDQTFQLHQSVHSTETESASAAYGITIPDKDIIIASHSDSSFCTENLSMDRTSSSVVNAENTELFAEDVFLVQNNKINSPDIVLQSDTGSSSLSGKETEGFCEVSSLQVVPCQSLSTARGLTESVSSNTPKLIDNRVHKLVSTCFPNPPPSQIMIGDGIRSGVKAKIKVFESTLSSQTMKGVRQSGVKAKIKAFESSLSQEPDYRTSLPLKKNHKIEAESARRRLWAEAASAEAAEARRRAEEKEDKLKSIANGREGKMNFQKKQEESRFKRPVKLERKYLERNEKGVKRQTQEDVKNITVSEEDIRTHEAYRGKEEAIQKAREKRPEIGESKRKQEDMDALRKHLKEQGENLLRATESKDRTTEEDPRQKALTWERMRLGELQLRRNLQDATVKSDLSAKENEEVDKSIMDDSTKALSSRIASEKKHDVGVQIGKSELHVDKAIRSVAEARLTTNEKENKRQISNNDLNIDKRVDSTPQGKSSAEDILAEEDATVSEEKLEDLVNGSTAFGRFIKQALGAAALLAAGALFMWLRGETMNRRRSRTAQAHNQHYSLSNGEARSRILQGEFGEPNSRIFNVSSEDLLCPSEYYFLM